MGEATASLHLKYIEERLVPEIVSQLDNETLESYKAEHSSGLDGFMSALYNIQLKTRTADAGTKERLLIAKFMKGDKSFRETSKSYVQFANEIFIYSEALPAYAKLLEDANIASIRVEDWVAHAYVAKFGYIEGLSPTPDDRDAVLVLEHLKPYGYKLGPRLYLNADHLLQMARTLGPFHACSYALRLRDEALFERLKSHIVPLPFINDTDPHDAENNLYRVLYRIAFDRFYEFFDRIIDGNTFDQEDANDVKLIERLRHLRDLYFDEPTRLLEHIRTSVDNFAEDRDFGVILHGDFNRNNVLFRYTVEGDGDRVENVKMIDFQELRYGTPAIDLSFFMYMNTAVEIRDDVWMRTLKAYHLPMFHALTFILKGSSKSEEERHAVERMLDGFSFQSFYAHFSRYAFYGVMICMHFLPWILCSDDECARLSHLFETDMHGEEFRKLSIEAGGDPVNMKILGVLRHACKMGYMDNI